MATIEELQFINNRRDYFDAQNRTKDILGLNNYPDPDNGFITDEERLDENLIPLGKTQIQELQVNQSIRSSGVNYDSGSGFWIGNEGGVYKFFVGDSSGQKLLYDGTNLSISGAVIAGALDISTGGYISSGQTAYNTGTGFWMEYNGGTPRFSIGDSTTNNSLTWDGTSLKVNGTALELQGFFGDGSDGDVTLGAGTTTLTADVFYNNLTVPVGSTLVTNGFRIFVADTATVAGTIEWDGNAGGHGGDGSNGSVASTTGGTGGTAGAAGAALADGSLPGAYAGAAGVAGVAGTYDASPGGGDPNGNDGNAGNAGNGATKAVNSTAGVAGTSGGTAEGTTAGAGGAGGTSTGTILNQVNNFIAAYFLYDQQSGTWFDTSAGAASGGSGASGDVVAQAGINTGEAASGGSGGSAGAGSSGGTVQIFAKHIVVSSGGIISSLGGDGGNGGDAGDGDVNNDDANNAAHGSGGGAGGAGGNGGVMILVYSTLINAGTISVAGGFGGLGGAGSDGIEWNGAGGSLVGIDGGDGAAGNDGNAGIRIDITI